MAVRRARFRGTAAVLREQVPSSAEQGEGAHGAASARSVSAQARAHCLVRVPGSKVQAAWPSVNEGVRPSPRGWCPRVAARGASASAHPPGLAKCCRFRLSCRGGRSRRAERRVAPRRAERRAAPREKDSTPMPPPPPPPEARPGAAGVCLPRTSAGRSSRLTRARRLLACRAGAGAVPLRRAPRALALLCAGGQLCCPPAAPGCVWQSSAVLANVLHWHDWGVDWGAPNPMTQLGAGARRCDPARTPHIYDRSQKAESQSLFETSPTGTNSPRRS